MSVAESCVPRKVRLRSGLSHLRADLALLRSGVLDLHSFLDGRKLVSNPVTIEHRNAAGKLLDVRYTHNLRTNGGGDWQAMTMGGFTGGNGGAASQAYSGQSRVLTAVLTATTATDTSASPAFNANTSANVIGRTVLVSDGTAANTAYGIITSATATVLTVDKWHTVGSATDATATTPAGAALAYAILPPMHPAWYIALTTDSVAPSAADTTLATEITTNGLARAFAAGANWTHVAPTGTTQQNTVYSVKNTFTASGSFTAVQKCGMFNASASGIMAFENTFSSVNMASADTLAVTWQVTA